MSLIQAAEIKSAVILSPCCGVCRLGDDQICFGCGRSISEIATWGQMTDRERQSIVDRLLRGMEDH